MRKGLALGFALGILASPAGAQAPACAPAAVASLRESFQALIDSVVKARPDIAGVSVHVEAPKRCLSWSGAAGVSERATGTKLTPGQPHRMASNTKTYVSAAVLRLYEDGKVKLDAPIAGLLSKESVETLRRGGYQARRHHRAPPADPHQRHLRLRHVRAVPGGGVRESEQALDPRRAGELRGRQGPALRRSREHLPLLRHRLHPARRAHRAHHGAAARGRPAVAAGVRAERLEVDLARDPGAGAAGGCRPRAPVHRHDGHLLLRSRRSISTAAAGWPRRRGTWRRSPARCSRGRYSGRRRRST